ncbi:hypothetical protein [Acinetobacter sp.]|uniref:hypothetical protein n=1 Tax=Acinetobacter sp. TaxID=472 RepID=UPI00388DC5C0
MNSTIEDAKSVLIGRWCNEGACSSCGWHALLGEHDVTDEDIQDALDNGGVLRLSCLNKDDEQAELHRGITISLRDELA